MAADLEIEALASQVDQIRIRAERNRVAALFARRRAAAKSNVIRDYRRLFLDEHGELSSAAIAVIADVAEVAQLGRFDPGAVSDTEMRERNGRRALALHILSQIDLDGSKLRKLAKTMRETTSE